MHQLYEALDFGYYSFQKFIILLELKLGPFRFLFALIERYELLNAVLRIFDKLQQRFPKQVQDFGYGVLLDV